MSTPQPQSAPQAPQIVTTSPAGHTTPVPNSPQAQPAIPVQPTAATTAPAENAPTTATPITTTPAMIASLPTSTPVNATQPTSADLESPTYNEQLNAVDRYWKFKMALAIALILSGIIGIGCIAWAVSTANTLLSDYSYGYDSTWSLPWGLITFSISIVWCFLCILFFVIRKRPVHPGVRVTMDLLLWLGFLVTALFTLVALMDLLQWGEYGDLGLSGSWYSSRYGDYVLQPNNTWVWEQDSDSSVTYERTCNSSSSSSSSYYYYNTPPFHNCAEMDAYVNALWHAKPERARVELTGTVCQFLGLVLHFALFVWACIDTHRHRRTKVSKDAEMLAAGIVEKMVQNGTVIPSNRQSNMRAPPGWQGAYQNLPSGTNSIAGQGRGYPPQMQGQHPTYVQQIAALQMGTYKHRSGEGPLPPLPPRSPQQQQVQQAQAGPSNEKPGSVAASYYEPQR
ncbi:hypothetical protein SLS59_005364 [Nothophoma quercina]|uniref:MARVEL domain-containing protein n=1 Tax=Nothophoma quercina TaxID=749835 RepID=A0ABR3RBB2_9PLEO